MTHDTRCVMCLADGVENRAVVALGVLDGWDWAACAEHMVSLKATIDEHRSALLALQTGAVTLSDNRPARQVRAARTAMPRDIITRWHQRTTQRRVRQ